MFFLIQREPILPLPTIGIKVCCGQSIKRFCQEIRQRRTQKGKRGETTKMSV